VHRRHHSRGPDQDNRNPIEAVMGPETDLYFRHHSCTLSADVPTQGDRG
jgi:hypothetical protein